MPAQDIVVGPGQMPPNAAYGVVTAANFSPAQLDQLLAPVALYPDPLLSLMLPASTNYADVVSAANYLDAGGDPANAEAQPWDDSIRALAHYPQIVRWMAQNETWTEQLGEAFAAQPDNVMSAIQRLRAEAQASGALVNSAQQQVVYDGDTIAIEPSNPDVLYIPYYDPNVVYGGPSDYSPGSYFSYSPAFATGWWLSYGLDWHHRQVWQVQRDHRQEYWREHRSDWNRPLPSRQRNQPGIHAWHPSPATRHARVDTRPRVDTRARTTPPRATPTPSPDRSRGTNPPRQPRSHDAPAWGNPTTPTRSTAPTEVNRPDTRSTGVRTLAPTAATPVRRPVNSQTPTRPAQPMAPQPPPARPAQPMAPQPPPAAWRGREAGPMRRAPGERAALPSPRPDTARPAANPPPAYNANAAPRPLRTPAAPPQFQGQRGWQHPAGNAPFRASPPPRAPLPTARPPAPSARPPSPAAAPSTPSGNNEDHHGRNGGPGHDQ